jgi:hypothetical protein
VKNVIQKLHIYAGLLIFVNLLVYGIAGLSATMKPAPDARMPRSPAVRYHEFTPPPNLTDLQMAAQIRQFLHIALAGPVHNYSIQRDAAGNLVVNLWTVNGPFKATLLEKENRLRVEDYRNNVWDAINGLHATIPDTEVADLRLRLWSWYNELGLWLLIGMALSGIYLGLASRPRYRPAQISLAAGTGAFLLLYVLTR